MKNAKITALTIFIGVCGWLVAALLNLPAPALLGPSIFVTFFGLYGLHLDILPIVRNASFVVIGITMGTSITPEILVSARQWPWSFTFLAIAVLVIFFVSKLVLEKFWKLDKQTAALASTPGHLSYILALSSDLKSDIKIISIIQSIRVLALTITVPILVAFMGFDTTLSVNVGAMLTIPMLGLSILGAMLLGFVLAYIKIPAAFLLGGMLFSILTHLTGVVEGHVPNWAAIPAFIGLGCLIGTRFSGVSISDVKRSLTAGLMAMFVAVFFAGTFAYLLTFVIDIPLPFLLVAFAPGGLETMAAMALIIGADPTFVAAHHIWRLLILTILAPIAVITKDR